MFTRRPVAERPSVGIGAVANLASACEEDIDRAYHWVFARSMPGLDSSRKREAVQEATRHPERATLSCRTGSLSPEAATPTRIGVKLRKNAF
jgi:hypothetical protein